MIDYDGMTQRIEEVTEFELITEKTASIVSREGKFLIELTEGEEAENLKNIWESYVVIFFLEKFRDYKQEWTYLSEFVQKVYWAIRANKAVLGIVDLELQRWRKIETDDSSITQVEMNFNIKTLRNRG